MSQKQKFTLCSDINVSHTTLWKWHQRKFTIDRLMPANLPLYILKRPNTLEARQQLQLELHLKILKIRAHFQIKEVDAQNFHFTDIQTKGPLHFWQHDHLITPVDKLHCQLIDKIHFALTPYQRLDNLLTPFFLRQLKKAFLIRHHITSWDSYWFDHFPLKAAPVILSFGQHTFSKTLQAFFYPFHRSKQEYEVYRTHMLEFRPQVVINALDKMISKRAEESFTRRLQEINPDKCIVLYRDPKVFERLKFIEMYCKYPVFFDCSALIEMQNLRKDLLRAKIQKQWLCEEELLASIWLALFDYTYSAYCTLKRSTHAKDELISPHRYAFHIRDRELSWSKFKRLYS